MDASTAETRVERDGQGRFAPGQSGNPAGKRPGTRNQATRLREILADHDVERAIEVLREQLRDGKGVAARFVLERLFPKPRDREIDLALPPPEAGTTLAEMFDRVLWLMAAGEITIDEASRMARLIEARGDRVETRQIETRPVGPTRGAAPDVTAAGRTGSPAFDLQTAGDGAGPVDRPVNRQERRRAAAIERAMRGARAGWRQPGAVV
jgi:hypothetical protein